MRANRQQGTAHRNHSSPNRAATQVSMKYRVKQNQCQDHILEPNQHSRTGQKMNRVERNPTSGQGQTRHKPVHMPLYPPNSQDSHAVSIRYKVIPSDKRARTTPENQSAQQVRSENEQGQTESNKRTGSNETQTSPHAPLPP